MTLPLRMLKAVRRLPRTERSAALAAAIDASLASGRPETADLDSLACEAIPLARSKRHSTSLLDALVAAWPALSAAARRALLVQLEHEIPAAITRLSSDDLPARRQVAAALVPDARAGSIGTPASGLPVSHWLRIAERLLEDSDPAVRLQAAAATATLARSIPPEDRPARVALDSALARAMAIYPEHRLDAVVQAVADALPTAGPALSEWLTSEDDAGQLALRGAKQLDVIELEPEAVLRWLATPALAGHAATRVATGRGIRGGWEALLAAGHLLTRAHEEKLRRIADPRALLTPAYDFSENARRGSLRWADALPMHPAERLEHAAGFLADESPAVRLAAANTIGGMSATPAASEILFEFALDHDPRVASAAAALLAQHRQDKFDHETGMWQTLARSPHEHVRTIASMWRTRRDPMHSIAAARRSLRRDRIGWLSRFASEARGMDATPLLDRLRLAERVGALAELETLLLSLTAHQDVRIKSKAIRCLRTIRSRRVDEAIETHLGDPDPRVRASAIEAAQGRSQLWQKITAHVDDTEPRVRANAIASMLEAKDTAAARSLGDMLRDERDEHRRAAVWVVGRTLPPGVASDLAELVRTEQDPLVKARAVRCARRLLMRSPEPHTAQEAMIA